MTASDPLAFDAKELRRLTQDITERIEGVGPGYVVSIAAKPHEWRAILSAVASHAAVRDKALEEAAKVADAVLNAWETNRMTAEQRAAAHIAKAIRALKGAPT